ncbi:uncharacterized protein LOC124280630 [Haliotis rubra]|uniref:uncharacterized protein LOC124280630 n=1 Tax=Haliotis rubra TaxID=36100 RepID=UPI001EE6034C|nr:uncharacterized protein LOC124280630 [Haliotis rubra]
MTGRITLIEHSMHISVLEERRSKEKHIQALPLASERSITKKMPATRSQTRKADEKHPQPQHDPQPQARLQPSKPFNVKEAYVMLLSELRIRSMIGSYMMYDQSDRYSQLAFWLLIVASILMGLASASLTTLIPVGDGWLPYLAKTIIGAITATAGSFKAGSIFLLEKFEKKQELFNKTGAEWQKLELKIRLFLDTADDTLTREAYQKFAEDCIEERTTICCLSKPERDIYRKYNEESSHILESYREKKSVVAEIQAELDRLQNQRETSRERNKKKTTSCFQRFSAVWKNILSCLCVSTLILLMFCFLIWKLLITYPSE